MSLVTGEMPPNRGVWPHVCSNTVDRAVLSADEPPEPPRRCCVHGRNAPRSQLWESALGFLARSASVDRAEGLTREESRQGYSKPVCNNQGSFNHNS